MHLKALAIAVALSACGGGGGGGGADSGGGGDGTTSASGNFEGSAVSYVHALSIVDTAGGKGESLEVVLSKLTTCADASTGVEAGDQIIILSLYSIDGSGNAAAGSATGTYTTDVSGAGPYVEADVVAFGSDCSQDTSFGGKYEGGTVTLTALSSTSVAGTLNLSDTDGSTLTGSFTTASCAALDSVADGGSGCSH